MNALPNEVDGLEEAPNTVRTSRGVVIGVVIALVVLALIAAGLLFGLPAFSKVSDANVQEQAALANPTATVASASDEFGPTQTKFSGELTAVAATITAQAQPTSEPPTATPPVEQPTATSMVPTATTVSQDPPADTASVTSKAPAPKVPATGWNPSKVNLDKILTREQVGGGADIIGDWSNSAAPFQVIANTLDRDAVIAISSDKGDVTVFASDGSQRWSGSSGDSGFIAVIALKPSDWVQISGVGFNNPNGHFNTWSECFVYPGGVVTEDNLKSVTAEWEAREKKPLSYFVDATGNITVQP